MFHKACIPHLVIRMDANARMGTGHLMRCLALAQGWQAQGGQAIFITACESDSLLRRLSDEGFQVVTLEQTHPDPADWETTSLVLAEHPDAWMVLDGYHFDSTYQRRIRDSGHRLLVIDDMAHLDHYYADAVLNQNIHAEALRYSCEPDTRLLLGTRYVLLRSEFLAWRGWQREIPEVARKVLVTLGGGVRTVEDVRQLLQVGADKVVINTAAVETPELIRQVSQRFGAQCVVVSIDARRHADGSYEVYTHSGTMPTSLDPVALARQAEALGAGEIIITSIERDGTMTGYDLELTRRVSDAVSIPVIASGGAGNYEHMAQALGEGNASAVAAASIFHFTQQTPLEAKRYLRERGFNVRL